MKRSTLNVIVDTLAFVCMAVVVFTGVTMGFFLGKGAVPSGQKYLWGLHRHDWGDIHLVFALGLVALMALHVILHWSWIGGQSRRFLRGPALLAILILTVAAAALFLLGLAYRRAKPGPYGPRELHREVDRDEPVGSHQQPRQRRRGTR